MTDKSILVPLSGVLMVGDVIHWSERQYLRRRGWAAPKWLGELSLVTKVDYPLPDQTAVGLVVVDCRAMWSAIPYKVGAYIEVKRTTIDMSRPAARRELWDNEEQRSAKLAMYLDALRTSTEHNRPRY